jgi:hypothetical protein
MLLAIDASAHFAMNIFDHVLASALEALSLVEPGTWAFYVSAGYAIVTALGGSASTRDRVPKLVATMMQIEPHPDARRAYARMLAMVLTYLCMMTPRDALEPMFARLRAICDLLTPSDPAAQRWFLWASSRALLLFEPAPWRALQAAEASLRDARLSGDRFVEHWILNWPHELQWWWLGDATAEDRLRAQLQTAIHRRAPVLQATSALQLARVACDRGDAAGLAEGARLARRVAEDPRGGSAMVGMAYECWARIELHEGRPAAELAARSRAALVFAPLFELGATATLARALVAERQVADAVRVAHEGLAVIAAFGGAGHCEVDMRLAACEAFFAAGDGERARAELRETLHQIRIRAEDIEDPGWRRSYLIRNVENRRARALADAWRVADPTATLLSGP